MNKKSESMNDKMARRYRLSAVGQAPVEEYLRFAAEQGTPISREQVIEDAFDHLEEGDVDADEEALSETKVTTCSTVQSASRLKATSLEDPVLYACSSMPPGRCE
jgi:hypothetical protein